MKKLIAIVLCIAVALSLSVTAFAAESPVADKQIQIIIRKANGSKGFEKCDVAYTIDHGVEVTVTSDDDHGNFDSWSIYKIKSTVTGTSAKANAGISALSVLNLAVSGQYVKAVEGKDYDVTKGSLTSKTITITPYTDIVICGNYDGKVTNPSKDSSAPGEKPATSPQTGDMTVLYGVIVMLAAAAIVFGAKKQLAK